MIHPALYRPVLFAGAEPAVVVLEVTTAFALVFGVGLHVATVLLALFYLTVVHAVMMWVAMQDPQMIGLYVRSLGARDFYLARARDAAQGSEGKGPKIHSVSLRNRGVNRRRRGRARAG